MNELLPQAVPTVAIVAAEQTQVVLADEADKLSASLFRPADLDKVATFTADELHKELVGGFISGVENSIWMEALAVDARRRMANGQAIGGHTTWTGYVNEYFRRENESIETTLRRMRRLLDGVEHAGKKHANKNKLRKTNRQAANDEAANERLRQIEINQAREQGFADGEKAGLKKAEFHAAKSQAKATTVTPPAVQPAASAPAAMETFWVVIVAEDTAPNILSAVDVCQKRFESLAKAQKHAALVALRGDESPIVLKVDATYTFTQCPPELPEPPKPKKKSKEPKSPAGQVHIDELPQQSGVPASGSSLMTDGILRVPDPWPDTQAVSSTKIPAFAYPGSKARLAKSIAAVLPSGKRFVEPFAGRGNVYFYVAAHGMYPKYWLNDIQTAPFLFTLRIGHILSVPKPGKESLYKYRAASRDKTKSPLARNHSLLLEPYLCWNGGVYGQSGGTRRGTQAGYYEKLRLASEILRGTDTKITRLDYLDVLAQCGPDDIVYLDPPYIDANVKAYSDKTLDHREMVEILKKAKFKWVLSEYEQPLYIEAFGEPALRIPVKRSMGKPNGGSKGQKEAVECFWANFTLTVSRCESQQAA